MANLETKESADKKTEIDPPKKGSSIALYAAFCTSLVANGIFVAGMSTASTVQHQAVVRPSDWPVEWPTLGSPCDGDDADDISNGVWVRSSDAGIPPVGPPPNCQE